MKENYDEYSLTYNGGGKEKSMILTNDIQYTSYDYDINKDVLIDKEEFVNNTAKELHKIHKFINNK